MVAGMPRDDDEEDEDDEDDDGKDYTEEQFAAMRFIVITKNRAKLLEKAFKFADPTMVFSPLPLATRLFLVCPLKSPRP